MSVLSRNLGQGQMTLADALWEVQALTKSEDVARCVEHRYRERAKEVRLRQRPGYLADHGLESWYQGPRDDDVQWTSLRSMLESGGWGGDDLDALDHSSTKVVAHLGAPYAAAFNRRGLVIGYVQSGKTTNFTAAVAKAADAGYKLFVVLSGLHEGLRQQTQERLQSQLVKPNPEHWYPLTEVDHDFRGDGGVNALLGGHGQARVLCVIKKNGSRLRRFLEWLQGASEGVLSRCPILVIDDEADQAGVNAARPENNPTAINGLIRDILAVAPKVSYVGYTATPFANVLIDPKPAEDLFPRDFIISLPRPQFHFGTESIFGREPLAHDSDGDEPEAGFDMVRQVPDEEISSLTPAGLDLEGFDAEITPSLREALHYFVLSTAARRYRDEGEMNATMLIHTTMRVAVHNEFRALLRAEIDQVKAAWEAGDEETSASLEQLWDSEKGRVDPEQWGHDVIPFADLEPIIGAVLGDVDIIIDNSQSPDRVSYVDGETKTLIAVGGNTLSRGLTLEGLCVSFFVRAASAYDTLLQMGRWFGYRKGYEDLPRIWMTDELKGWFRDLATVEQEIRYEVERYEIEGMTPMQLGPRIRTHPSLAITAASKMRSAVYAQMSYSGRRVQTILFEHKELRWLEENIAATKALLTSACASGAVAESDGGRIVIKGVEAPAILNFLGAFNVHPNAREMNADLLRKYIRSQTEHGELESWTVAVLGLPEERPDLGGIDLGVVGRIPLINRSQVIPPATQTYANIKSLMSKEDRVVDLGMSQKDLEGIRSGDVGRLRDPAPAGRGDGSGLLAIYPISKHSTARGKKTRQDLDAIEDVIGVGLVFPTAETDVGGQDYMTADLEDQVLEEPLPEDEAGDESEQLGTASSDFGGAEV